MFLRLLTGLCLVCSLSILAWAYWPVSAQEASLVLSLPAGPDGVVAARQAILKLPSRLRLGETGKVSLSFLPTGEENPLQGYSLLAESALELRGFEIAPAVTQQRSLVANQPVQFEWQVVARAVGKIEGTVPLNLHIYFENGRPSDEILLSAQRCTVTVFALFGLNLTLARLVGVFGCVGTLFLFLAVRYRRKV